MITTGDKGKVVTKIRAVLFRYPFCLGFAAFVVNLGVVELAVTTDMKIGTAFRAFFSSTDRSTGCDLNFISAAKAEMTHGGNIVNSEKM